MSGREHLSKDVLLQAIYGIADAGAEAHLHACSDCALQMREWQEQRSLTESAGELSNDFLAAQRRKIYDRLETAGRPSRKRLLWAPALAAACALALGVLAYHPNPKVQPAASAEVSDTQLFSDVFSIEHSPEPSATAPVRVLFEEQE